MLVWTVILRVLFSKMIDRWIIRIVFGNLPKYMNILIIEHDMSYAQWLKKNIGVRGYRIEIRSNAQEAQNSLSQKSFHLVLVNIFLPDSTGSLLISKIKTISPKVGIIAMTDRNSRELEMQIRSLDILYYMIKPIDKKYLTHLLDHVEKKSVSVG